VIARLWRGWTKTAEDADAYEELLRTKILPELSNIDGHEGAYVLRGNVEGDVEFVVLTLFDSMTAVRAFAGEDSDVANVSPEARNLLSDFEEKVAHYETVVKSEAG
jgi:heme-degrading monooxygenase HmoA